MWARRLHAAAIACGAYLLCAVGPVPAPAQGEPADAVANADTQTTEAPPLWSSSCSSGGRADPLVCNARQSVVISQTGQRLIVTTLETEPGQPERLYLRVPQGVFIPEGVRFEDDGETVATLPIQTCDDQGCLALAEPEPALVDRLREGSDLTVVFDDAERQQIRVPLQLSGFAAAYDRIRLNDR